MRGTERGTKGLQTSPRPIPLPGVALGLAEGMEGLRVLQRGTEGTKAMTTWTPKFGL
jgi:hypothetical protein